MFSTLSAFVATAPQLLWFFAQARPRPSGLVVGISMAVFLLIVLLFYSLRILREYERGVIFRLGRLTGVRGPGPIFLIPVVEQMVKVDTRITTIDVPTQDIITKDNVSVKVNAVIWSRVVNPKDAIINIEQYRYATSQAAQTKLRDVLGQVELDELLSNRDEINDKIQEVLDVQTDPWGIKVETVELKHVDLPPEMVRAMAKQAEAERERRAKVISAEGEFQASTKLGEAAEVLGKHPISVQLRYLQTLVEIAGSNQSSTTIFPLPIDLIAPLTQLQRQSGQSTPQVAFPADPIASTTETKQDDESES